MGLFGSSLSFGKTISTFLGSVLTSLFKVDKTDYSNFNIMIFTHNIISLSGLLGLLIIDDKLISMKNNIDNFNDKNCNKQSDSTETEVDIYNEKTSLK